jgi:Ni/Fe-hydrogenase subunit HybB-like protein
VLILGIGAFALLARRKTRHLPAVQITAAAMYVVAIFFKRYSLMAMGFSITSLGQKTSVFVPSLTELGIAGGLLALGLLIVTVFAKILPLAVPEEEIALHSGAASAHGVDAPALDTEVA